MASPTTISGLSSGIDWQSMVDALMQVEAQKAAVLENRKSELERKNTAWDSLQTKLQTLQSTSDGMDKLNELLLKAATSSDTDTLTVSADATAIPATHDIVVNQLAQNQVLVHTDGWPDAYSTSLATAGNNEFVFTYDGTDYTVTVNPGATLADLVNAINDKSAYLEETVTDFPGITASFIDDGGATNPYHLVLSVNEATSSDLLSISATTTVGSGSFGNIANWETTQNAQESQIRVDGYPSAGWITRPTNTIDDVIDGVTINLKSTNASATKVAVSTDTSSIEAKIQTWVDAYNDVVTTINGFSSYDSENNIRGVLMDDSQARLVRDQMITSVTSEVQDLPANSTYTTLGSAGINIGAGGLLTVDTNDLGEALASKADEVARLFVFSTSTTNNLLEYQSSTADTEGGTYDVFATYKANGTLDSTGTNTIGGYAATIEGTNILRGKDGTPVEGLRIWLNSPGTGLAGTTSATIRVGNGLSVVASDQVEKLTDSVDGLIKIVKESYSDQIANLEEQIAAYETRMNQKKEMLTDQFIKMEQAISQAKNQANWASSALSG